MEIGMKHKLIVTVGRLHILLPALVFLLSACTSRLTSQQRVEQEYTVYTTSIERFGQRFTCDLDSFTIQNTTMHWTACPETRRDGRCADLPGLAEEFPSAEQETLEEFVANNAQVRNLTDCFDLQMSYTSACGEESGESHAEPGDNEALVRLSSVGLNREADQALVYLEFDGKTDGYDFTAGYFVLLERAEDAWRIVDRVQILGSLSDTVNGWASTDSSARIEARLSE
jgi:hypothetical protein